MKRSIHGGLQFIKSYPVLTALHEQLISQFLVPNAPAVAVASLCFKKTVVTIGVTAPFFQSAHTCVTRQCCGAKAQEAEAALQRKLLLDVMTKAAEIVGKRAVAPEVETRHLQFFGGGNN
jgi:hypothetical protein